MLRAVRYDSLYVAVPNPASCPALSLERQATAFGPSAELFWAWNRRRMGETSPLLAQNQGSPEWRQWFVADIPATVVQAVSQSLWLRFPWTNDDESQTIQQLLETQSHWVVWAECDTEQHPVARTMATPPEVAEMLRNRLDFIAWSP